MANKSKKKEPEINQQTKAEDRQEQLRDLEPGDDESVRGGQGFGALGRSG